MFEGLQVLGAHSQVNREIYQELTLGQWHIFKSRKIIRDMYLHKYYDANYAISLHVYTYVIIK